jgi:hypothetical protein
MGSAARRCGAYGGEYLPAELSLRVRGGRRKGKTSSQTRARKETTCETANIATAQKTARPRSAAWSFYRRGQVFRKPNLLSDPAKLMM